MRYADDKDHGYGVNVNPEKFEKHACTERDQIVVLAEN